MYSEDFQSNINIETVSSIVLRYADRPNSQKMPSFDQDKFGADVHSSLSSHPSADKDDSYDVYTQARGLEYPSEEAKKVLRKIDTRLIPLLVVIYMLQVRIPCCIDHR
jgi:hypothetical protein